jgi:hypothetical protein
LILGAVLYLLYLAILKALQVEGKSKIGMDNNPVFIFLCSYYHQNYLRLENVCFIIANLEQREKL